MDPVWLTIAFACGFAVRQVGLPPLVGFLAAGFVLNALGVTAGEALQIISDLGVSLLLFTIGLKLDLRSLMRAQVWAGATVHMAITVAAFASALLGLGSLGVQTLAGLDLQRALVIAFALSFSSTVFAVKILEDNGTMNSVHGRVAIGILIVQDIVAVLFLTLSSGELPSLWALAVALALWGLRPLLKNILGRCGHGEVLVLYGFFLALVVGAAGFELVGLKADLGALILGILVADHAKAEELAKALLSFKDLFLVGFFLSIGLSGTPTWNGLGTAAALTLAMPFKVALFLALLTRFRLRARSSLLSALSLANYSEFGLIVGAVAVRNGWLDAQWLIVIALALSMTFVIAAPLNAAGDRLYRLFHGALVRWGRKSLDSDDQPVDTGEATVAVFGMGRIGSAAFDFIRSHSGETVIGVDFDRAVVAAHRETGRNVVSGDPTDPDFWATASFGAGQSKVKLVLLGMSNHKANVSAAHLLLENGFRGHIAAIASFDDQVTALRELGVHTAFDVFSEAGVGLAEHALERLRDSSAQ